MGSPEQVLMEVAEQLLTDAAAPTGPDSTRRMLAASLTTLGADAVRFESPDGQVLADWRSPGPAAAGDPVSLSSELRDGARLTVEWQGPVTVGPGELGVIAELVGLVEQVTAAQRHADALLRVQRQLWGQEIHDGVTQSVTAAVMLLERVKAMAPGPAATAAVDRAQEQIRAALRELRDVLAQVVEDDEGTDLGADQPTLAAVVDDVRSRWRLQARVTVRGQLGGLTDEVAAAARAALREALVNVSRHAGATHVVVSANRSSDELRLTVTDDGPGVDDGSIGGAGLRTGLRLMGERLAVLGGRLEVAPRAGGGTTVTVTVPLAVSRRARDGRRTSP